MDANQPAILIGETGSGKTTLCQSILSQGRPHFRIPASPLLHVPDLRKVLENMRYQQSSTESMGKIKNHPGMLLFIDDLHEAPLGKFIKHTIFIKQHDCDHLLNFFFQHSV